MLKVLMNASTAQVLISDVTDLVLLPEICDFVFNIYNVFRIDVAT